MRKTNSVPNAFCNLQKIFTAYVVHAVQHQRWQYLRRMNRYQHTEEWHDDLSAELSFITNKDIMAELPLLMRIENDALLYALKELSDRERDIFYPMSWAIKLSARLLRNTVCTAEVQQWHIIALSKKSAI